MKKSLLFLMAIILMPNLLRGQTARDNHLFLHVNFAAGNVYTAAFPSLATWGLNELTKSNIFESALEVPFYSTDGFDLEQYSMVGYTAHDLFKDIHPSLKIGYQTRRMSDFNWGIYASGEYIMNQFKTQYSNFGYESNKLQRFLVGGSAFVVIGGVDKMYHFMIEAGGRYSMALNYEGPLADGKDGINNGLVSHFALKVTGAGAIQDFGIYADFNHFDLLKRNDAKLKMFNIGIMWTVTPGQRENRTDIY
jgi:hypothetical protein